MKPILSTNLITEGKWSKYPSIFPFINILYTYQHDIPDLANINTFIETGTHNGTNAEAFSAYFDRVLTVEIAPEEFMSDYRAIHARAPNVKFCSGTSVKFLQETLPTITERCVILLDAHSSSFCPLVEELTTIREYSSTNDHVLIIDDTINVGVQPYWPDQEEVENLLLAINPEYTTINTEIGEDIVLVF